ncbi:FAD-dependent monooxygenase [Tumebacillus lipolyticus]|uniref:FAD-dependent monooxygenase n=1 Tax=Tumebacillus lipolyticus TaxID=1280370 RepID=A0ABW4ZYL5_9BACL
MSGTALIIGGGIAGLTAAVAMQQLGFDVRVYERYAEVRPVGAGIMVAPNALQALDVLGLAHAVQTRGRRNNSMMILDRQGRTLSKIAASWQGRSIVTIHRADLHQILLDALKPGTLILGKSCLRVEQDGKRVTAIFADGSTDSGDLLVAADGIHSPIRTQLFPDIKPRYAGYTCWRGIAHNVSAQGICEWPTETWGGSGRFGIVPLPDDRIYWYALLNGPAEDSAFAQYKVRDLSEKFSGFHSPVSQVLAAMTDEQLIRNDIYDLPPLSRFASGRVLLIGDAAHAVTPNLGQGACQAIEDGVMLMKCVAQQPSIEAAFRSFELLRKQRVAMIAKRSLYIGKLAQLDRPLLCRLRDGMMRMIPDSMQRNQMTSLYKVDFAK